MVPLRVCLDARIGDDVQNGVGAFIIGLAYGLSSLTDGDEEYLFLAYADSHNWLKPYISGPCRILNGPSLPRPSRLKGYLKKVPFVFDTYHRLAHTTTVPHSDGVLEKSGAEVMHFTWQNAFLTDVPSIYHPHDLQHRHYPENFTPRVLSERELLYRTYCDQAAMVAMMSSSGKQDVVEQFGIPPAKVGVIPGAAVLSAYRNPSPEDLRATKNKYRLPDSFVFYPAQAWPHKNHFALLDALAILREQGMTVPLVCSGFKDRFYSQIEAKVRQLKLEDQVQFLGFVSPLELQCLYRMCRCFVFPSKFEGWGMPVLEAFLAGAPAAVSNISPLKEQALDAAILFDPDRPQELADAIRTLWTDEDARTNFSARARQRAGDFDWKYTARLCRAHYRRLAGRQTCAQDQELLSAPPLV